MSVGASAYAVFLLCLFFLPAAAFAQTAGVGVISKSGPADRAYPKAISTELIRITGQLSLSVDGTGSADNSYQIEVEKPNAQASVQRAFLLAAAVSERPAIADGTITLQGTAVSWDGTDSSANPNTSFFNHYADVTTIVKPIVDAAGIGRIPFTVDESAAGSDNVDGTVLAVIFDDPQQTQITTIILMFGAQENTGDQFAVTFVESIDPNDPSAIADMGLAISFSSQEPGAGANPQFSTVDVNGTRLTSAAGGEDDGATDNGALMTVGGLDDSNVNPADPNQSPTQALGDSQLDDELYSLLPLLNGPTNAITIDTLNPSNDDNIFFAYFRLSGTAIIGQGITLTPLVANRPVNAMHTVTAHVVDSGGAPVAGVAINFDVLGGPNTGAGATGIITDANGEARFTYTDTNGAGTDTLQAFFNDGLTTINSNTAIVNWVAGTEAITLTPVNADRVVNSSHTVTAQLVDGNGAPLANATIDFSVLAGPNMGGRGQDTTDANGIAVFSYSGTGGLGSDSIQASFNNGATTITSNSVNVNWIAVPEAISLVPPSATLIVNSTHTVTAQVTDTLNAAVAGILVDFTISSGPNAGMNAQGTTDVNGQAMFSYAGTGGLGQDVIQASFDNGGVTTMSNTVNVSWIAVAETISLAPADATLIVNNTHTVTAQVTDTLNAPVANLLVNFTVISGPNAGLNDQANTAADGTVSFSYSGSAGVGADTIQASFNRGVTIINSNLVSVTWITLPETITLAPVTATLSVNTTHTVTAQVTDTLGDPVAGISVDFTVINGPNATTSGQDITNNNGNASFSYAGTAGAGTDELQASFNNGAVTELSNTVNVIWQLLAIPTVSILGLGLLLVALGFSGALARKKHLIKRQ